MRPLPSQRIQIHNRDIGIKGRTYLHMLPSIQARFQNYLNDLLHGKLGVFL